MGEKVLKRYLISLPIRLSRALGKSIQVQASPVFPCEPHQATLNCCRQSRICSFMWTSIFLVYSYYWSSPHASQKMTHADPLHMSLMQRATRAGVASDFLIL